MCRPLPKRSTSTLAKTALPTCRTAGRRQPTWWGWSSPAEGFPPSPTRGTGRRTRSFPIDPQFIALESLEDFAAIGGEAALEPEVRRRLDAVRVSPRLEYRSIRELKQLALRRAFAHFRDIELASGTRRGSAFRAFVDEQAWWLDDYGLFRALHAQHAERAWTDWPDALRNREEAALAVARGELADDILFRQYLQWVAGDRSAASRWGPVPRQARPSTGCPE